MTAWDLAVMTFVACLAVPIVLVGCGELVRQHRARKKDHAEHRAWMDGLAEGAGLDERDRKEALRRRLRLD